MVTYISFATEINFYFSDYQNSEHLLGFRQKIDCLDLWQLHSKYLAQTWKHLVLNMNFKSYN